MKVKYFLALVVITLCLNIMVVHGETGLNINDAIPIEKGIEYTKVWTSSNDDLDFYTKITITRSGRFHYHITKPICGGDLGKFELELYNSEGVKIFEDYYSDSMHSYVDFYYGLNPGIYYINIDPSFLILSGSAFSRFSYDFEESDFIEIEDNNYRETANYMEKDVEYKADLGGSDQEDWYFFGVNEGKYYRVYIGSYSSLNDTTAIIYLYNNILKSKSLRYNIEYDPVRGQYYYPLYALSSGFYYLRIYNYSGIQIPYTVAIYEHDSYNYHIINEVDRINTNKTNDNIPVYRMYNRNTGEHLYTTDAHEVKIIYKEQGWGYEGIAWYGINDGVPVYRLYQPQLGNHLYTSDLNEVRVLTNYQGWTMDFNGQPILYSNGTIPIYRLYNQPLNGQHHLTTDANEYRVLPFQGWAQEGISLYANKIGKPQPTDFYHVTYYNYTFYNF